MGKQGSLLGPVPFDRFINGGQNPDFPGAPTGICLLTRVDPSSPHTLSLSQPLEEPHPQEQSLSRPAPGPRRTEAAACISEGLPRSPELSPVSLLRFLEMKDGPSGSRTGTRPARLLLGKGERWGLRAPSPLRERTAYPRPVSSTESRSGEKLPRRLHFHGPGPQGKRLPPGLRPPAGLQGALGRGGAKASQN